MRTSLLSSTTNVLSRPVVPDQMLNLVAAEYHAADAA
jgi:hypothetical protein